uniref:Uncharacterized protein n=1 Tax=viral metagenome TaxID=1070528 RepID=A0A6H1ZZU7_9ZZZZ
MVRGDSWVTGCAILLAQHPDLQQLPYRVDEEEIAVRHCAHMMDLILLEKSERRLSDLRVGLTVEDET